MGIVSGRIRKQIYKKCEGRCGYCSKELSLGKMQVDHIAPTYWNYNDEQLAELGWMRGTDDYENLMPACVRCNKWKSDKPLEVFRQAVTDLPDKKIIVPWDGKFHFEKMPNFSHSIIRFK